MNDFEIEMLEATDEQVSKMLDILYLPYQSGKAKDAQITNTILAVALVKASNAVAKKIFKHFSERSERRCWQDMILIKQAIQDGLVTVFHIEKAQSKILDILDSRYLYN